MPVISVLFNASITIISFSILVPRAHTMVCAGAVLPVMAPLFNAIRFGSGGDKEGRPRVTRTTLDKCNGLRLDGSKVNKMTPTNSLPCIPPRFTHSTCFYGHANWYPMGNDDEVVPTTTIKSIDGSCKDPARSTSTTCGLCHLDEMLPEEGVGRFYCRHDRCFASRESLQGTWTLTSVHAIGAGGGCVALQAGRRPFQRESARR